MIVLKIDKSQIEGAGNMLKYLESRELEAIIAKRPRLKEKLEGWQGDGIKVDLWQVDTWAAGKRPLLLLARMTYSSLPGKADYRLIMSQPGKNGAAYSWECPAVMPGAKVEHPGGRPRKYGHEAKERAKALRADGFSIRGIAAEMGASTFTIQKLLKSVDNR